MKEHRISASAIVFKDNKVLLVRCPTTSGKSFLLGPGGGIQGDESLTRALVREVKEETGMSVHPIKIIFIEDLVYQQYRMVKVWFLCNLVGGQLTETQEAKDEGIIEIGWYSKEQLKNEIVFPRILKEVDWDIFAKETWQVKYLEFQKAEF